MSVRSVPSPAIVSALLAQTGAVLWKGWELAIISSESIMFQYSKQIKQYSEATKPPSLPAFPAHHVSALQSTIAVSKLLLLSQEQWIRQRLEMVFTLSLFPSFEIILMFSFIGEFKQHWGDLHVGMFMPALVGHKGEDLCRCLWPFPARCRELEHHVALGRMRLCTLSWWNPRTDKRPTARDNYGRLWPQR